MEAKHLCTYTFHMSITAITKVSMLFILLLAFSACSKLKSLKCEKREVEDEGIVSCVDWNCTGSQTHQLSFCGDELKDAKVGNTITLSEDDCCKKTRTFLRSIP